jgi:hypothetical protein
MSISTNQYRSRYGMRKSECELPRKAGAASIDFDDCDFGLGKAVASPFAVQIFDQGLPGVVTLSVPKHAIWCDARPFPRRGEERIGV